MQDFKKKNKEELIQRAMLYEPKILSLEENLNLPLPRLEIRVINCPNPTGYQQFANIYGIVRENFDKQIELTPLEWSLPTTPGRKETLEDVSLSWRLEAHLMSDMIDLNIPGYWVKGSSVVEIKLADRELPMVIKEKLQNKAANNKFN